jgi:hypothetical protein
MPGGVGGERSGKLTAPYPDQDKVTDNLAGGVGNAP